MRRPFGALFDTLDELDERLDKQRFLFGDRLTEADWRLFTTLVRFDAVYFGHFKCNLRRIADYPQPVRLSPRPLPDAGRAETVNLEHIKQHYYRSHDDQSDPHRARRPGASISTVRTAVPSAARVFRRAKDAVAV